MNIEWILKWLFTLLVIFPLVLKIINFEVASLTGLKLSRQEKQEKQVDTLNLKNYLVRP